MLLIQEYSPIATCVVMITAAAAEATIEPMILKRVSLVPFLWSWSKIQDPPIPVTAVRNPAWIRF